MSMVGIVIFVLTATTVTLSMYNHWNLSKGRLDKVYPVVIVNCVLYIVVETIVALRDPAQLSLLMYHITNVWAIVMAIRGWNRLVEEKTGPNNTIKKETNNNDS